MPDHQYIRPCNHCDAPVSTSEVRGKVYCSVECYRADVKMKIRPKDVVYAYKHKCEVCGKSFGSNLKKAKSCSQECSVERNRRRQREIYRHRVYPTSKTAYKLQNARVISLSHDLDRMSQDEIDAILSGWEATLGLEYQIYLLFEQAQHIHGMPDRELSMLHHIGEFSSPPRQSFQIVRHYA